MVFPTRFTAGRRRPLVLGLAGALLAGLLVGLPAPPAAATPVATDEATYQTFGRVFPDPHGCLVQGGQVPPEVSPWAKGNVCAAQFLQWEETLAGLRFLEQRLPGLLEVINLRELREQGGLEGLSEEEVVSAGLPREDRSRAKRDLYVIKVTNTLEGTKVASPVPEEDRRHFAYALSIHGIERAGVEGGIRAIEDLVTWAACEKHLGDGSPVCEAEGPFPKRILEPFAADGDPATDPGPTAGQVLDNAVIYFVLANPDGWRRGEYTEGGAYFQRYNGNGMDLNRDWPTIGYTQAEYTPWSEPETRGYGKYLQSVRQRTSGDSFAGAIDLHGMLTSHSFSFTLLGAGQRDYRKNAVSVDTSVRTFRDAEQRLTWSSHVARAEECPGEVPEPLFGRTQGPMCTDQWGTVWDTIDYQVTGSFGDWMDSPLGLDGVGIDNEMALSHITPNNVFDPTIEQLHIDGNKGLIYSQISSMLIEQPVEYVPGGRIAYLLDPQRITHPGGGPADGGEGTPTTTIRRTELAGEGVEFAVADGVAGLTVEATFTNARGVSGHSLGTLVLECKADLDHGDCLAEPEGQQGQAWEWREVARYFNQSAIYLQGGARIDVNSPLPGVYRIRPNPIRTGPTDYLITFSGTQAFPVPEQEPYDVSRMDFFEELNTFVAEGSPLLEALSVQEVLNGGPGRLREFDTLVVANDFMPGLSLEEPAEHPFGAQEGLSLEFGPAAAPVPSTVLSGQTAATSEPFQVGGPDSDQPAENDLMVVTSGWETASDYDVVAQRRNPQTGEWRDRGCECVFINNGEQIEIHLPEPGTWRVQLRNWLAVPQPVTVEVSFEDVEEPPPEPDRFSEEDLRRYVQVLKNWTRRGGNLVLTDAALAGLPDLVDGIEGAHVTGGVFYAGWMDFSDGESCTYPDDDRCDPASTHHLARAVQKPGAAEGRAELEGQEFAHRHQTYEPTPLGYFVSPTASANAECDIDTCDSPNWVVDPVAWQAAGGTVAARTLVRASPAPNSAPTTGVSLGETALGQGVVRIAGAVLPDPTEANYHPFGLSSYALTYTGYQLFENLTAWDNPSRRPSPQPGRRGVGAGPSAAAGGSEADTDTVHSGTGGLAGAGVVLTPAVPDRARHEVDSLGGP